MSLISVRIPQLGEGLHEARLVAILKQSGDQVKRDEPIYQMETDKAVVDVESPFDGRIVEWLAEPDDILSIGAEVARVEVAGSLDEPPVMEGADGKATPAGPRNASIAPKTRAYAKEKGLDDAQLGRLAAATSKLLPSDIDAYLASHPGAGKASFSDKALDPKQRVLASRFVRGSQLVVPGTMRIEVGWDAIENLRARYQRREDGFKPSAFTMFAFAVTHSLRDFPIFRSTLIGDDTLRTYDHVHLGIAVSLPEDQLVLAVIPDADTLSWREFADAARERIDLARTGQDQASEAVALSLTSMQGLGILDAVPVVVPPAVATLFLGASYNGLVADSPEIQIQRKVRLAMTFDHRVMNGVGAAEFMNAVRTKVETISALIEGGLD